MVKINIIKLLKENNKSKYWLCQKMNITTRNLNRIIHGETKSISRILQLYIGKKPLKPRQNLGFFMSNFFIFYVVLCCVIWYN